MLIDHAVIEVFGGKGGDGHVSFRRLKYIPKGGPSGGDGGRGGDVILHAQAGLDTLMDFSGRHHWRAEDGGPGENKQKHGRDGEDLVIHLPPGTLVYDEHTGELIADLDAPGKSLVVARGGAGGFGNEHFKSATHQTPRESTPGDPGEQRALRLELKLIADIGLVGKPNAGKSTLLSRLSRATPRIADYPFTTLEPGLGIAELDADGAGRRLVIADIPGLIEGAHSGAGLGIDFLRHIERTRLLVHVVDIDPSDGSDPVENYRVIRRELGEYSQALLQKPQVIALSKMDLLATDEDRAAAVTLVEEAIGHHVVPISAATGLGLTQLLETCWQRLRNDITTPGWRGRNLQTAADAEEESSG